MKKFILLLAFLPANLAFSQEIPSLQNIGNRKTSSLNGKWNYIVDLYETGYYNFHLDQYDRKMDFQMGAYYFNYHSPNKQDLVEYDFDKSPVMNIPGDWNSQTKDLFYYEGTVWFKRSFDYSLKAGKRLFLNFGAVNYKADVYLNGIKLGAHTGGFTSFSFEVSAIIKNKNNFLVVKVDNKRQKDAVPSTNTDWWNYGGITRDITLIETEEAFIEDYSIQLGKQDSTKINGYIRVNNARPQDSVMIRIPELNISYKSIIAADSLVNFEFSGRNIKYWTPGSPKLYRVLLQYNNQTLEDEVGFRTIATDGGKILLNGRLVFLKGICMHEENAKGGRGNSKEDALRLLSWAKELGCNYVRLAHYPHNENIIRLADKMGLLVWEEIPVYWTIDFKNPATYRNAETQLKDMIARDKNRAAVIIWSMANETPLSAERTKFITDLISVAREKDPTRLISAALLSESKDGIHTINDPLGAYIDLVAFNQYLGWYGGNLEDAEKIKWSSIYNKPLIVSEFGGDARQGLHGSKYDRWNEEFQEYLYIQNLKMIDKIPNLAGLSPWILVDFRSPRRLLPGIQDGYNRKGLISNEGKKKKAFWIMKKYYQNKP
ncbi:MAG: beta galactosidase jelly roll domain-containing protein [Sphingobacteriales bacterium]|nr:beta galactosidase jelly roll domain-containing protein [Sphingobacteriales bacterium]